MQEEIKKAQAILYGGGLILYPTDTVWGIGCDATNAEAVQKVYALKKRAESKAMICLVANDAMLERHVKEVPEVAYDILDLANKPTTIIYDNPVGVAKNLIAADNSLAIRVTKDQFCQYLINAMKKPLVSTSANISGMPTPTTRKEVHPSIVNGVDYVVDLPEKASNKNPSTIIKLGMDGAVKVIRK